MQANRNERASIAHNAGFVAEGFTKCHSEHDTDILGGVVTVNVKVAGALYGKRESAVDCKRSQHVVEESYARINADFAAFVEVQLYLNVCFPGFSGDFCGSVHSFHRQPSLRTLMEFACAVSFSRSAMSIMSSAASSRASFV